MSELNGIRRFQHRRGEGSRMVWVRPLVVLAALVSGIHEAQAQRLAELPWWDRFSEATSEHYVMRFDLPLADAQAIARHLDRMYEEYSRRLSSLPQRAPVKLNIYLFQSRRDYELTLRSRFGVNASGTGGLFFVTGSNHGLAIWTEGLSERRIKHVLQHEGFHQFAWSRFGEDLPNWVNEGLAEFFGLAVLVNDKLVIGQSQQRTLDRIKDSIELGEYLPFQDMIDMSSEQWLSKVNAGESGQIYDQAWSMVHFLVYAKNGKYQQAFERYLRLINNGLPSAEAFGRAFETSETSAFEQRWREFILVMQPSALVTALERIEFLARGSLELAKRGIHPESLEALRAQLRTIEFTHTFSGHRRFVTLEADDDEVYLIPGDEDDESPAVFEVSRPNLRRMTLRDRKLEAEHPSPSIIRTVNLVPKEIVIEWNRGEGDPDEFTYRIRIR